MRGWRGSGEAGLASASFTIGFAFGLIALLLGANVVAIQYTRCALQAAADAGARTGAVVGGTTGDCQRRAESVLHGEGGLLRGSLGETAVVRCSRDERLVEATGSASLGWWLDLLSRVTVEARAHAVVENPQLGPAEASQPSSGSLPSR